MQKASEIMTRALATCAPDTDTADVAALMRDRDIGDVLVVDQGELRGIVTDRDLAIQALTGHDDPRYTPVRKYMSGKVVTGEPGWNLQHLSDVMAKHQVRRLPIVEHGQLVGVVSLGDVALHAEKNRAVAKSLQAISRPAQTPGPELRGRGTVLAALALAATATTLIALRMGLPSLSAFRRKSAQERLVHTARQAFAAAKGKIDEAAPGEKVQSLTDQMRSRIKLAI